MILRANTFAEVWLAAIILIDGINIDVARHFVMFGRLLFPRYFFYAVFSTTLYIIYLTILMQASAEKALYPIFWADSFHDILI